jgi:hypothetical protein
MQSSTKWQFGANIFNLPHSPAARRSVSTSRSSFLENSLDSQIQFLDRLNLERLVVLSMVRDKRAKARSSISSSLARTAATPFRPMGPSSTDRERVQPDRHLLISYRFREI